MEDKLNQIDQGIVENSVGLDDHSEELNDRSEADAQIRFYRAMADTEVNYGRLLTKLARTVAEVIFDLCVVYLIDDETGELKCPAAYHPHPETFQALHQTFANPGNGVREGLVNRVISRQEHYFRPRWRPSLLKAYTENQPPPKLNISIHSLMVVPMVTTEGHCLGALLVGRHTTSLSYDETDLALTQWIASHAAMKLETARLYRDLRRTNHRLDTAVQERDTFISIASHELRTPLSTLKLHAQMLQRKARRTPEDFTPEEVIPKLAEIDYQVDRLDKLVDQLLNVSRIFEGGMAPSPSRCELCSIIDEVVRRFSHELSASGSALTIEAPDSVIGMWDCEHLDHIVTNLLSNAIKYGGGNPITIVVDSRDSEVFLRIRDRGRGIAPSAQKKIFERFERAEEKGQSKGLGLGLWIVQEYVESLQGSVEIDSAVGVGTTFTVRLPRNPK